MRRKHRRTLEQVLTRPTPSDIKRVDIKRMLAAVGVEVSEGSGSRVRLVATDRVMIVHRPHPRPETGKATVRDVAAFLASLGVEP